MRIPQQNSAWTGPWCRGFVACSLLCIVLAGLCVPAWGANVASDQSRKPSTSKPNIIIVLADDLGFGSVGFQGAPPDLVQTPNIDRLAREGMRFTDANTPSSVCSPTRYALLTGRYCWRSPLKQGVVNVLDPLLIEPDRPTLASLLKRHGYRTAMIGKWHLGYGRTKPVDFTGILEPGPLELGFDYQFAVPQNNGDMTGVYVENHRVFGLRSAKRDPNPGATFYGSVYLGLDAPQRDDSRNMPLLTEKALAWLKQIPRDEPFFLYFAATAVHEPITPSSEVTGSSGGGPFTDFIRDLDRTVGCLLDALEERGAEQNTLFLFTSDNGGVLPPANPQAADRNPSIRRAVEAGLKVNGDWRGGKHTIWEGGFRVPFVVRWPDFTPSGTNCHHMIGLIDVYATVAELLGETLEPPDPDRAERLAAPDSVSFLSLLRDPNAPPPRDSLILHNAKGVFAIRRGPWKYIEGRPFANVTPTQLKNHPEYHSQLYNIEKDPGETTDLLERFPEEAQRMEKLLEEQRRLGFSRSMPRSTFGTGE
ncbi:MAG: sulfatase family protein [Thermogutta sp.]